MTDKKRKREAPLAIRLPKGLRLLLAHSAAAAGMTRNAYIVALLSKAKPIRSRNGSSADRQMLGQIMAELGNIATMLRDISAMLSSQQAAF